jgi:hypothetical protein
MLSHTAATVYCELFLEAQAGAQEARACLEALDAALDSLITTARDKRFQLAGKFESIYRQKTVGYCFTYRIEDDARTIQVIEISPLLNGDGEGAHALLRRIVTDPQHKAVREVLGIPENGQYNTPAVN